MRKTTHQTKILDTASELNESVVTRFELFHDVGNNSAYFGSSTTLSKTVPSSSIFSNDLNDLNDSLPENCNVTLNEILSNAVLLRSFESYLVHAFCQENLLFIEALRQLRRETDKGKVIFALKRIWKTFFTFGSPLELNVSDHAKRLLIKELNQYTETIDQPISIEHIEKMFHDTECEVLLLLESLVFDFGQVLRNTPGHSPFRQLTIASNAQKKVVIVGGGFTGFTVASILDPMPRFYVKLIDLKDSFEYTPGAIKKFVNPTEALSLRVPHDSYIKNGEIVIGYVDKIEGEGRCVWMNGNKIDYDYLVIATGSSHSSPFKSTDMSTIYQEAHIQAEYKELAKAETILIIGGGLVACELASEISHAEFPAHCLQKKKITIVESGSSLVKRATLKQQREMHEYMKGLGVQVITNERILDFDWIDMSFTSAKGHVYRDYDKVFVATGNKPRTTMLSEPEWDDVIDKDGMVRVKPTLQVQKKGMDNIFVGGDITNICEEKTGYAATLAGVCIARNICRLEKGKKPLRQGTNGTLSPPREPLRGVDAGLIGQTKLSPFKRTFAWLCPEWAALKQFNEQQFLKIIQGESYMMSMAVGRLPRKLGPLKKRISYESSVHDLLFEEDVTGVEGVLVEQMGWTEESSVEDQKESLQSGTAIDTACK